MSDFARGQELVKLREARHLSQEDAAHDIGVSAKSLRSWEHGGPIRWDNAKRVAAFYEVEAEGLVSRELGAARQLELSADELEEIHRKLDEILKRLPPAQAPPAGPPPDEPIPGEPSSPTEPPDQEDTGEAETG